MSKRIRVWSVDALRRDLKDHDVIREGGGVGSLEFGRSSGPDGKRVRMLAADGEESFAVSRVAGQLGFATSANGNGYVAAVLANLSTSHSLRVRRWPWPQTVLTVEARAADSRAPVVSRLSAGWYWVTTNHSDQERPGWLLVQVDEPLSTGAIPVRRAGTGSGTATEPTATNPERPFVSFKPLTELQKRFMVHSFARYLSFPPRREPTVVLGTRIKSNASALTREIVRNLRQIPEGQNLTGQFDAGILGIAVDAGLLDFEEVEAILRRDDLLAPVDDDDDRLKIR